MYYFHRLVTFLPRRSINMSTPFATEKQFAIAAVRRACRLTSSIFELRNESLTKDDRSPVTVGDFSAQAVINTMLGYAFPHDPVVAEETAEEIRRESNQSLRDRIVQLANEALNGELALGDDPAWGVGPGNSKTTSELLDAIDRGNHPGGRTGRMWTLDPIDGTKGFLRGGQYAVCLALIVDAQVQLGVIGCPNLLVDPSNQDGPRGCIFVAVRGQGAEQLTLEGSNPVPLLIPALEPSELNLLESVDPSHASHSFNDRVSSNLGIKLAAIRMDSQAKYGSLARAEGGVYLRMPTGTGYQEKIWDHAPGAVLVEEAGGMITDSRGERLDFGLGRTLGENFGIIASGKGVHLRVIDAISRAKVGDNAKV